MIEDLPPRGDATRIVLVRHAEPSAELQSRCYGRLDAGLSAAGAFAARGLADALAAVALAAVYTSPRERAHATAAPIAAHRGFAPIVEEGLSELDFGDFEGRTYDEIAASHPALYTAWMRAPTTVRFPGGESYADLRDRVGACAVRLRARHAGDAFAIVSHGGVVRAILGHALAMPDAAIFRLGQPYCAVSVVDWFGDEPLVRTVARQPR